MPLENTKHKNKTMNLKTGHQLAGGRYRVERVLGQGGFGITYLAEQTGLARRVAVKEFFMKELCNRDSDTSHVSIPSIGSREMVDRFRQKFIKEARALAALNHKHIVRIIDIFEENNTAYYVMEYVDGGSLSDKVKAGALPEADALRYIRQVATALNFVHGKRMMHLDVKPSNILLNENDEAVLIDFGLAKQYDDAGSQTSTTPVGISHGYAPMEQYKRGGLGTFSPATDIYSLGATLYKLVTGLTPPEAGDVNDDGLPALPQHISASVRAAVEAAMQPRRKDRPQSIGEFLSLLEGNVKAESGKVKTESNDDGATVIATSSTPGGEVSRSDGGENVEKSKDERAKSKDESDGATEILHSVQDDKKRPDDNTLKRPFSKRLFTIISVAAICIIAAIFGIKSCNDRKAAEAEAQRATAIAEQQRIDADRKAQERADSIATEQQRLEQERLAKEAAEKAEQQRIEADRKAQERADSIAAERQRLEQERLAKEAAEKAEQERIAAERKAKEEAECLAAEKKRKEEEERKRREASNNNISTRSYTVNGVSFKMIAVEGGTFKMGATAEQQSSYRDEKPVHDVTLGNYSIGETEVTQALWQAVMGSNPSHFSGRNNPVENVSYNDCITFINKLNTLLSGQLPNGRNFRLPTEAEWEYAARGGNRSRGYRYSGSDNLGSVAWCYDNSGSKTHQVKQKQANELGLYDMSGNVWEWCNDWHGSYSSSSQTNPKGPSSGSFRVLRGGSWFNSAPHSRVPVRGGGTPDDRNGNYGLRLAL